MQVEYDFTLPRGFVDEDGEVHRNGRIRLATMQDEVAAVQHPRVQSEAAYLPVVLLARVITQLGPQTAVSHTTVERLFATDVAYLQDLYLRLNGLDHVQVHATCPHCQSAFHLQVSPL